MIAVDTNVLVHAHNSDSRYHQRARSRLVGLAAGAEAWGLPVFCLAEFLRVITHPRVFTAPLTIEEAIGSVKSLVRAPSARVLNPGPRFTGLLLGAIDEARARGNLVFDAQIVAVCREHGVRRLITEDRDFARFRDFATVTIDA